MEDAALARTRDRPVRLNASPVSQDAYTRAGVSQSDADSAVAALVSHLSRIETGKPSRNVPLPGHYASVLRIDEHNGIAFGTDGVGTKMVVAEKLVTALQRGRASTRWRDFADLFMLVPGDLVDDEIIGALRAVAKYRGVPLQPLGKVLDGMPNEAQARWATWRERQGAQDRVPEDFAIVLDALDERTQTWLLKATE